MKLLLGALFVTAVTAGAAMSTPSNAAIYICDKSKCHQHPDGSYSCQKEDCKKEEIK